MFSIGERVRLLRDSRNHRNNEHVDVPAGAVGTVVAKLERPGGWQIDFDAFPPFATASGAAAAELVETGTVTMFLFEANLQPLDHMTSDAVARLDGHTIALHQVGAGVDALDIDERVQLFVFHDDGAWSAVSGSVYGDDQLELLEAVFPGTLHEWSVVRVYSGDDDAVPGVAQYSVERRFDG